MNNLLERAAVMKKEIKVLGLRCLRCKDIVWSRHRHDFRSCKCGACAVDGGRDYLKITYADRNDTQNVDITLNGEKIVKVTAEKKREVPTVIYTHLPIEIVEQIDKAFKKLYDMDMKLFNTFKESFYEAHLSEIGNVIYYDMTDTLFYSITGEPKFDTFYERFDCPASGRGKPVAWSDRFIPDMMRDTLQSDKSTVEKASRILELYLECKSIEIGHALKELNKSAKKSLRTKKEL